jgi:hypothetical protein
MPYFTVPTHHLSVLVRLVALGACLVLLSCAPIFAADQSSPTPPAASQIDSDSFALGFSLEFTHQRALGFVASVHQLSKVSDNDLAADVVRDLINRGEANRRLEADALGRSAQMIHRLNGSAKVQQWAEQNAAALIKPFEIKSTRTSTEESLLTDHLTAIIDDTSRVQKELLDNLSPLIMSVKIANGESAIWTCHLGSFAADAYMSAGTAADTKLLQAAAKELVSTEPAATALSPQSPAVPEADKIIQPILPTPADVPALNSGSGNLSSLLPSKELQAAATAIRAAPAQLFQLYDAVETVKALDTTH